MPGGSAGAPEGAGNGGGINPSTLSGIGVGVGVANADFSANGEVGVLAFEGNKSWPMLAMAGQSIAQQTIGRSLFILKAGRGDRI